MCVLVCVSSVASLLPYSFCRSWLWPCTTIPSGSYIHDRYREREKHSAGSKSVTVLTKTCQGGSAVCLGAHVCMPLKHGQLIGIQSSNSEEFITQLSTMKKRGQSLSVKRDRWKDGAGNEGTAKP